LAAILELVPLFVAHRSLYTNMKRFIL